MRRDMWMCIGGKQFVYMHLGKGYGMHVHIYDQAFMLLNKLEFGNKSEKEESRSLEVFVCMSNEHFLGISAL